MSGSFSFPVGDVVRKMRAEGNEEKVAAKAGKLPHPIEVAVAQRNRMAVTEELRALRGVTDKALALKICTELQACNRTLLGTDEMIGFEDYLKHPDVDETIEHYFMRT